MDDKYFCCYYEYMETDGEKLYTAIMLPKKDGTFPTVVMRCPYDDIYNNLGDQELAFGYMVWLYKWLENGYAVVYQHCRGRGKSGGEFIPYINEREDGLKFQDWIRKQAFYNGELYLNGQSYLASVHYATAPFADDIKGAIFNVQDCERYNVCYRNGFLKKGLHGDWYAKEYKAKSMLNKNYTIKAFDTLPLSNFSKTVLGENAEDFAEMIKHPNKKDEFWNTRFGGNDARNALKDIKFPFLLTTAFNDIYTGGIFDMWNSLTASQKEKSAFVVSPYDHGDSVVENSIVFENGKRHDAFGQSYEIQWFNYIRGVEKNSPFAQGKITYYRMFENKWITDDFEASSKKMKIELGNDDVTYVYNPYDAPEFNGGLSCNFGGAQFQEKPNSRYDIISIYSNPFDKDTTVKGKMGCKLCVKSDCEDTCFYVRISITKEQGDLGLRDDITSLCYQLGDYVPNTEVMLDFSFDEHTFLIKKGEKLRIDISSADNAHYIRHTNIKGLFSEQREAKPAKNTVICKNSYVEIPIL